MSKSEKETKNKLRLAINGFGRTGRAATRIALENPQVEVVAINSKADAKNYAYLLKYDSLYGSYKHDVSVIDDNTIAVDGRKIKVFAQNEDKMPWQGLNVDIVLESSGKFTIREKAEIHLKYGAKRVIIGAPSKGEDQTFVFGVNEKTFDPYKHFIVSNASCTTNCLAPLAMILDQELGIIKGFMTTAHAYTNDQRLHDNSHKKDLRRARAAPYSIIPTSTGAATAIGLVLPQLKGKLDGVSLRVPVPVVSIVDLTLETQKSTTAEEVNQLFYKYEKEELKGILGTSDDPLVSVDFKGDARSSIVDTLLTQVSGGNLVKVFSWYDNEWGYAARTIDLALYMHQHS